MQVDRLVPAAQSLTGSDPWIFSVKVISGAAGFVLLGGVIYWRKKLRTGAEVNDDDRS